MGNQNELLDVDLNALSFLIFQGGGGKGITYLGALEILQEKNILPLKLPIPINKRTVGSGNLVGIAGASAGAITSYLVALGLTTDEIRNESGFLPAKENPNYDKNDPNSQKYMPGESVSNFDFNDFFRKDQPTCSYRRAVVEINSRNILSVAVDGVKDMRKKKTSQAYYKNKAKEYGLPAEWVNKVIASQTNKEKRKLRGVKVTPAQHYSNPGALAEASKTIRAINAEEFKLGPIEGEFILDKYYLFKGKGMKESNSALLSTVGKSKEIFKDYIYNIIFDMGLFPGFGARNFFIDVTKRRLPVKLNWDEEKTAAFDDEAVSTMNFEQFYAYTGVDLVISGVNVTTGNQHNFSKDETPDFPVIGAIEISMNIPGVFKPIYVDAEINSKLGIDERNALRQKFKGLWVDGGLAVNLPFHAFDNYPGVNLINGVNPYVLGLRLHEGPDPNLFDPSDPFFYNYAEADGKTHLYRKFVESMVFNKEDPDFPSENYRHLLVGGHGVPEIKESFMGTTLFPLLGWTLNTFLHNNTESQLNDPGADKKVLGLYTYHIGTLDFKADDNLTEFVVRRAEERARHLLGVE